jgi:hypothetical protein
MLLFRIYWLMNSSSRTAKGLTPAVTCCVRAANSSMVTTNGVVLRPRCLRNSKSDKNIQSMAKRFVSSCSTFRKSRITVCPFCSTCFQSMPAEVIWRSAKAFLNSSASAVWESACKKRALTVSGYARHHSTYSREPYSLRAESNPFALSLWKGDAINALLSGIGVRTVYTLDQGIPALRPSRTDWIQPFCKLS